MTWSITPSNLQHLSPKWVSIYYVTLFLNISLPFFLSLFIFCVCERQHMHHWGRDREGERESIPSRVWSCAEPLSGLHLTNCEIMTWAKIKSPTVNQLSHPGAPSLLLLCEKGTILISQLWSLVTVAKSFSYLRSVISPESF